VTREKEKGCLNFLEGKSILQPYPGLPNPGRFIGVYSGEEPRPQGGVLLKKKPHRIGGSRPQSLVLTIHPRSQHGAFWLFHVKPKNRYMREL
jgi:hypothetical protein